MKVDEARQNIDTLISFYEKYNGKEKKLFEAIVATLNVASRSLEEWSVLKECLEECPPTDTPDAGPYEKAINEMGFLIQDCIKEIEGV